MSNHTIRVDYEDLAFLVNFDYSPFVAGRMYMPNGDPGYPDEPEERDICTIHMVHPTDKGILPVDVTDCFNKAMNDWFDEEVRAHIHDD